MRKCNFTLRLQPSLLDEVRKLAAKEGVALNQFINFAVAEKLCALRTEDYYRGRAAPGDVAQALAILNCAGVGNPSARAMSSRRSVCGRAAVALEIPPRDPHVRDAQMRPPSGRRIFCWPDAARAAPVNNA